MVALALGLALVVPQALGDAPGRGVSLLAEADLAAQRAARLIELDQRIAEAPLGWPFAAKVVAIIGASLVGASLVGAGILILSLGGGGVGLAAVMALIIFGPLGTLGLLTAVVAIVVGLVAVAQRASDLDALLEERRQLVASPFTRDVTRPHAAALLALRF